MVMRYRPELGLAKMFLALCRVKRPFNNHNLMLTQILGSRICLATWSLNGRSALIIDGTRNRLL